jgi:excisionase family DNA binding protein
MFFRSKQAGGRTYLQLVENRWHQGRTQQRVIATVGRLDQLLASGGLEALIQSGSRFCKGGVGYIASAADEATFSSHQLGKLLQISPSTVVTWVNQGKLPAHRTPGGHRRIKLVDVREFLRQHGLPLPAELGGERRRSLFIVDDDPLFQRGLRRAIEQQHGERYEIDGCQDGIEALVMIGARQPDLVLLDIHMEGIDGYEVCRRLRRIPQLAGLRIVAVTAYPSEEGRARILDYGANGYWTKPIAVEQVVAELEAPAAAQAAL